MSATYRQDSKLRDDLKEKDPNNKYYARYPRMRLQAEQVRDQGLCISGTISNKMYGPGVMPWQPEGIWSNPYNSESWVTSKGEDQYRRSIYTFVKRTAGYPSMITFDGSQRIVCTPLSEHSAQGDDLDRGQRDRRRGCNCRPVAH